MAVIASRRGADICVTEACHASGPSKADRLCGVDERPDAQRKHRKGRREPRPKEAGLHLALAGRPPERRRVNRRRTGGGWHAPVPCRIGQTPLQGRTPAGRWESPRERTMRIGRVGATAALTGLPCSARPRPAARRSLPIGSSKVWRCRPPTCGRMAAIGSRRAGTDSPATSSLQDATSCDCGPIRSRHPPSKFRPAQVGRACGSTDAAFPRRPGLSSSISPQAITNSSSTSASATTRDESLAVSRPAWVMSLSGPRV